MNKVLDCEKYVQETKIKLKKFNIKPTLVIINASDDKASESYIKSKRKLSEELGFEFLMLKYDSDVEEKTIIDKVKDLNMNTDITGIILQLPIYKHLNKDNIINSIDPMKDLDGLTTTNKGLLDSHNSIHSPCTALGIVDLLKYYKIDIEGKHIVILGRSELVGMPLYKLLLKENATVTICHSKTKDINNFTQNADILITAIGKPKYIKANMIKEGSVLIDVGISRVDGRLYGDIDFDDVFDKCSHITTVPKGIGIITTITLMSNLVRAYLTQRDKK